MLGFLISSVGQMNNRGKPGKRRRFSPNGSGGFVAGLPLGSFRPIGLMLSSFNLTLPRQFVLDTLALDKLAADLYLILDALEVRAD